MSLSFHFFLITRQNTSCSSFLCLFFMVHQFQHGFLVDFPLPLCLLNLFAWRVFHRVRPGSLVLCAEILASAMVWRLCRMSGGRKRERYFVVGRGRVLPIFRWIPCAKSVK